jgi:hypothetical protein
MVDSVHSAQPTDKVAALRWHGQLSLAGGRGDEIFPPADLADGSASLRHVFETGRTDAQNVPRVLSDRVKSQAHLDAALLRIAAGETASSRRTVGRSDKPRSRSGANPPQSGICPLESVASLPRGSGGYQRLLQPCVS